MNNQTEKRTRELILSRKIASIVNELERVDDRLTRCEMGLQTASLSTLKNLRRQSAELWREQTRLFNLMDDTEVIPTNWR